MRAPRLWCCVSSSRKKVQVATPQPQLCEMTVWSFGQNTPKRPKCTCDRLDLPESTQPDPPVWAAENVCFQSCIVWLFLQWLRDGWLGLPSRFSLTHSFWFWPSVSTPGPKTHSGWWSGNDCWHSYDQNAQMLVFSWAVSSPLQGS